MASLTITQISPVVNTVSVTQTVSPVSVVITEQITQNTVVVSPLNITNFYGGGGEVLASLVGVAPQSTTLGTFTGSVIADNETVKGALQDLEDGVEDNVAAISTNAADVASNTTALSAETAARTTADSNLQSQITNNDTDIASNVTSIGTNATAISNETTARTSADAALQTQITSNTTNIATNVTSIATNTGDISQLQTDLANEVSNRTAADSALTSSLNANTASINTNTASIASNLSLIQSNDGDILQLQTDLSSESSARASADSTLTAAVNANTTLINNLPGPSLATALDPTETQLFFTDPGTFAQGTSIESVLRQLLIHFQPPVMTLSGWTSGTYEHGASYSDTDFTLSFSNFSNVDASDNGTAAFTDTYISNGTNAVVTPASSQTVSFSRSGTLLVTNATPAGQSGSSVSRSNAAKLTLSSFTDSQGSGISNKAISSTVRYRYWILDSTTAINFGSLTNANGTSLVTTSSSLTGANAVESGLYSSVGNLSLSSNGSYDYVYWVYPTAVTVNNINNPLGLPIYTGDTTGSTSTAIIYIGTFTLTNQHGADVSMTVLRTKNSGALGSGTYTVS
jgi:hypothetical protein